MYSAQLNGVGVMKVLTSVGAGTGAASWSGGPLKRANMEGDKTVRSADMQRSGRKAQRNLGRGTLVSMGVIQRDEKDVGAAMRRSGAGYLTGATGSSLLAASSLRE